MKKFQIEEVRKAITAVGDKILLVNYYPAQDNLSHFSFYNEDAVKDAKSKFSAGKWNVKCLHNWKTNIVEQYQECKNCGIGHAL